MKLVTDSRLIDDFFGYWRGTVYRLADGSSWRQQQDKTEDGVFRSEPVARVYWDGSLGRHLIDIEGSSGSMVWVERYERRWSGVNAY